MDGLSDTTKHRVIAGTTVLGLLCVFSNGLVILSVIKLRLRDVTNSLSHILLANLALTDLVVGIVYIPAVAILLCMPDMSRYACVTIYMFLTCPVNTSIWGYRANEIPLRQSMQFGMPGWGY